MIPKGSQFWVEIMLFSYQYHTNPVGITIHTGKAEVGLNPIPMVSCDPHDGKKQQRQILFISSPEQTWTDLHCNRSRVCSRNSLTERKRNKRFHLTCLTHWKFNLIRHDDLQQTWSKVDDLIGLKHTDNTVSKSLCLKQTGLANAEWEVQIRILHCFCILLMMDERFRELNLPRPAEIQIIPCKSKACNCTWAE